MKKRRIFTISVVSLALLVLLYIMTPYQIIRVQGDSMTPALKHNDWAVIKKTKNITRDDIVVMSSKRLNNGSDDYIIKRIKGIEGDTITIKDFTLTINNETWQLNDYIDPKAYTMQKDYIFVLGDNHNESLDSKNVGPLPKNIVQGKIVFPLYD